MATTVNSAFTKFNAESVNLDTERTKTARASRDWLIKQLEGLPTKVDDFPILYDNMHIKFGSFARNTKIKPLDDIDLMLTFSGNGTTYLTNSYGKDYALTVPESATNLRKLCDENGILNSIKLVNKVLSSLDKIEHYKSAEKHRRQEAVTLKLNSYEWNFDIVPSFYTDTGYYIIPNGSGGWKATDPRIDQNRISELNQKHKGKINQIVRTLKFWNNRASMPTIPSYLIENIIINFFNTKEEISDWIDVNLINFWNHLSSAIYNNVPDPKGFQDDLNTLSRDDRDKIAAKASDTYDKGYEAYKIETSEKNQEKAINKWRLIFGNDFPTFG
jgi:hypothetical protein